MSQLTDRTQVVILTHNYRVEGKIAHFSDMRLTDYMIESKIFIAVTDAKVSDRNGNVILKASFLNVRSDRIEIIVPIEDSP